MLFHLQALQLWPVAHFFLHGEFLEGVPSQVVPGHTPESECERAEGKDGSNEGVLHRHGMIPVFTPLELSLVNVLGSGQHGQQWGRVGMGLLRRDLPTLYHSAPQDLHHGL